MKKIKKLVLSSETVRVLDVGDLDRAIGGADTALCPATQACPVLTEQATCACHK